MQTTIYNKQRFLSAFAVQKKLLIEEIAEWTELDDTDFDYEILNEEEFAAHIISLNKEN